MDDEDLMTIGRFARLSGVSVHALRHYDDAGLLIPAHVDEASGYRRYRRGQIGEARLIRALRWADLPVEGVRRLLAAARDDDIRDVLSRHLDVLQRRHSRLSAQIADVTRFLQTGVTMPVLQPGCRPVQIKIAVQDRLAAVGFYQALAGKRYRVTQRTADADYSSFAFGEYGRDDFFLLWLLDDPRRADRPGRSRLGFLVHDLDEVHRSVLGAGGTEVAAPADADGTGRHSLVADPSGNRIELLQGDAVRPVQLTIPVHDALAATAFFEEALGLRYQVSRRTADEEWSSFLFGEYGRDDFFLLWLDGDAGRPDRPGRANLSFLVDDLDVVHARAIAAGATELAAPHDTEGMPRNSAITDPSGNWIGLVQA
ncbi:MAG TPA: VOC family protein [Streptosporangiaceae bacterium]|jgi:DNA-binding transcriptional MerR regulator|nr:VOC family protein [Streptosporangiaceae bacterium]